MDITVKRIDEECTITGATSCYIHEDGIECDDIELLIEDLDELEDEIEYLEDEEGDEIEEDEE